MTLLNKNPLGWYSLRVMRYLIIGDIHGNLTAFETVLRDVNSRGGFNRIWCLGDLVGYGPEPHECIELLCQYDHLCVVGNHDWAAIGKMDTSEFNPIAAQACHWTSQQLTKGDREYLGNLPFTIVEDNFTLVHGSPREPIWEYILTVSTAQANFDYFETAFCLTGHTHVPVVFEYVDNAVNYDVLTGDASLVLGKRRLIINPGGVGQPRDGDSRASYAVYDSEGKTVDFYRIEYDIEATQEKMRQRELPLHLILRLSQGL